MARLIIYGRQACHLCEQMEQALKDYLDEKGLSESPEIIDIDTDSSLIAEYAGRIPVLKINDKVICEYFLDIAALDSNLS